MTCTHNHNCGCGSLSNANIKAVIEGLLTTALDEKDFDALELKNSIYQNLLRIGDVQDKLNDFKSDMALNLSALLTKTELASIKSELENLIKQQQNIYEDLQRAFEVTTSNKLLEYKSDVQDIQKGVAEQLSTVQRQLAELVPTRDAYKIALQNGYVGSEASWLDSLKGHSAYTLAKAHGFKGSEAEWLSSLKGDKGPVGEKGIPGANGLSAYEVAKKNGYVGSESTWLNSLIGNKGERGVGLAHVNHNKDNTLTFLFSDNTSYTTKSLKGDQGIQGPQAKSVYDIAVSHGFKGDEKDWLKYILENSETVSDLFADADSLEQFVNGSDSETVLTRLSKRYPTLQKALKELFENNGIAGRFKTLAELQVSPLVDGDYALVADDAIEKNGIYIKEGGVWKLSAYDPLSYVKKRLPIDNSSEDIIREVDVNNQLVRRVDKEGRHWFIGLGNDLKSELNRYAELEEGDSNDIFHVRDILGRDTLIQNNRGELITVADGNISQTLVSLGKALEEQNTSVQETKNLPYYAAAEYAERIALKQMSLSKTAGKAITAQQVAEAGIIDHPAPILRIPALTRIDYNKYLLFYEARQNWGDTDNISLGSCVLTVDTETKTVTNDKIRLIHNSFTDSTGKLRTFMNACAVILDDNKIICLYVRREGLKEHELYMRTSEDMGDTWSEFKDISYVYKGSPDTPEWNLMCPCSQGIVKRYGSNKGRIIFPAWTSGSKYVYEEFRAGFVYSDDQGETWHLGGFLDMPTSNEVQCMEDLNGDILFVVRLDVKYLPKRIYRLRDGTIDDYTEIAKDYTKNNLLTQEAVMSGLIQGENKWDDSLPKFILTACKNRNRTGLLVHVSYDGGHNWKTYEDTSLSNTGVVYTCVENVTDELKLIIREVGDPISLDYTLISMKNLLEK